jgi:hypothetical protein
LLSPNRTGDSNETVWQQKNREHLLQVRVLFSRHLANRRPQGSCCLPSQVQKAGPSTGQGSTGRRAARIKQYGSFFKKRTRCVKTWFFPNWHESFLIGIDLSRFFLIGTIFTVFLICLVGTIFHGFPSWHGPNWDGMGALLFPVKEEIS